MIVAVFTQVILKWVVKMENKCRFSPESKLRICWTLQKTDRKLILLSVSHNQNCLTVFIRNMKKKNPHFYFLQCLTLQPQCKHSLAILFGFVKLRFGQKNTMQKKKKKKKKDKLFLFLTVVSHPGTYPLQTRLSIFFTLVHDQPAAKSWWPVADGTFSIWSWLLVDTVQKNTSCTWGSYIV